MLTRIAVATSVAIRPPPTGSRSSQLQRTAGTRCPTI